MMTRIMAATIVLAASCAGALAAPSAGESTSQGARRSFRMGFTDFPHDFTPQAVAEMRKFLRENSDIIAQHIEGVPWPEAAGGQPFHPKLVQKWKDKQAATPPGAKVYLALSPGRGALAGCHGEKENMPMPAEFRGKAFDDPAVMKAYLAYCRRGVEFFRPDYLAIGIEVNEIIQAGPDKWRAYVRLHRHVYGELRKEHPKLPIFASFTLHGMLNLRGQARAKMLAAYQEIMPHNDIVGVSFYPFIAGGTTDIAGALAWLTGSFDSFGKPYAFVETGEAAQKLTFPSSGAVIAGTPAKQAAYYKALLAFAQSRRAEFVISFLYRDYDALWDKIRATSPEAFMAWRDCGLLDEAGTPRPAYEVWKQSYTMPLATSRPAEEARPAK
jgi:hypothetical protein